MKKRLKDPIYGYIEVDKLAFAQFIDTPAFQRLRRVVQTSYGPLYPAASHTRFVHSLGVYFLGCLAADALHESAEQLWKSDEGFKELSRESWSDYLTTFRIACLLHDLGHAPFSHAGEQFYDIKSSPHTLDDRLCAVVGDTTFSEDVKHRRGSEAAPHERMSAILGIQLFREHIPCVAFFARCITGYSHEDASSSITLQVENMLISLLNSTTIDVDKLDYLIRDSFVVGFESTSIDYKRLLHGLVIRRVAQKTYALAYHKSAISVLENVIYARDFEKKWVQAHPVIIYDQFLIQRSMQHIDAELHAETSEATLFCEDALTETGKNFGSDLHISLLSDDDVIYLAKNKYHNCYIDEYFNREKRRHPVWKSEAEYRSLFRGTRYTESIKQLITLMRSICVELNEETLIIDANMLEHLHREKKASHDGNDLQDQRRNAKLDSMLSFLDGLKQFCEEREIDYSFAVIFSKGFTSGFNPTAFKQTRIFFPGSEPPSIFELKDVSKCLGEDSPIDATDLFYLYHRQAGSCGFPRNELASFLQECLA